jgi:hypothetical protein
LGDLFECITNRVTVVGQSLAFSSDFLAIIHSLPTG